MRVPISWLTLLVVTLPAVVGGAGAGEVAAQLVTRSVRFVGVSERFYERTGVSFGFGGGLGLVGCFGRFGSSSYGFPAYGRIQPSAGLAAGWSVRRGSVGGRFGFHAVQGMQRSFVSSTGRVTGLSGYPATMTNVVYAPFVTGLFPFGGYAPYAIYPQFLPYGGFHVVPPWREGFPQRAWPVVEPQQTLGDRWKVARRRFAEKPVQREDRDRRPPRLPTATGSRSLSSAAFRQLGGRPSRR